VFSSVIKFMYSGKITLHSPKESDKICALAYEYLLDNLIKFCGQNTTFPATFEVEESKMCKRLRKMVANPIGGDVFFILKNKKMFAHRVILHSFSEHFRQKLKNMIRKSRYPCIRVKSVTDEAGVQTFVQCIRLWYR